MGSESITVLLEAARRGEEGANNDLFAAVYSDLREIAHSNRRRWRGNETLNTTALIHEAFLRLSGREKLDWQNRAHFYATASKAMRQILFNYAEKAGAKKRGGGEARIPFDDARLISDSTAEELLQITEYMQILEQDSPRRCRIVECRVFGGMDVKETALALGISPATVKREWRIASALLRRNIQASEQDAPDDT